MNASRALVVEAPAKINLGLRITGVRDDGYHSIESVFAPLDLADTLHVESHAEGGSRPDVELRLEAGAPPLRGGKAAEIPVGGENLAVRAALEFCAAAAIAPRVRIRLVKRIPAAAGLGGGSSDAAAVLRALSTQYPGAVTVSELAEVALGLGADVPFFLRAGRSGPALVTGIGERIEPIEGVSGWWIGLLNPRETLVTADVYGSWDEAVPRLTPARPGSTMRALSDLLAALDADGRAPAPGGPPQDARAKRALAALLANDLEAPATARCPVIGELRSALEGSGALAVGMSGSGATAFGVYARESEAHAGLEKARRGRDVWSCVARTLSAA